MKIVQLQTNYMTQKIYVNLIKRDITECDSFEINKNRMQLYSKLKANISQSA